MDCLDIMRKRQSIRKYKEEPVRDEDLRRILEAARVAPSGKNCQNWHFAVIRDRSVMEGIADAIRGKNEEIAAAMDRVDPEKGARFRKFVRNFTMFYLGAPVLIVVYATDYYPSGYYEYELAGYPAEARAELFRRNPGMQNIGAAVEHMCLEAVELGYGTCWMTGQNYAAAEIEAFLHNHCGFSREDHFLACMLSLGVPEDGAKSPGRKSLEEICTFIG